jgi:hypothetical protein
MSERDSELMARVVAAARPVRPRTGWRQEVWERIDEPPRRSWGLALAAAMSFATVMAIAWLPAWAAERAADRTVAASYAERWEVHDDILRVRGQVSAWEAERAAVLSELARNEQERRAVVAELVREAPSTTAEPHTPVERAKPAATLKGCESNDPLCGL